jgi:hypothetical protein
VQTRVDSPSDLNFLYENGNVRLNWKDNSYSEKYFIIEGRSVGPFAKLDSVSANITTYILRSQPVGVYLYRINAVNPIQKSNYSNTVEVLITDLESNHFEPISIYPNPATDILNVKIGMRDERKICIEIFDVMGSSILIQKVSLDSANDVQLDIGSLPSGLYSVLLKFSDGSNDVLRFIKK